MRAPFSGVPSEGVSCLTRVCLPQLHQTWCSMLRSYSRLPTWRTGLWPCCSVPWKRTASRPLLCTPTPPEAIGAFYASPPRSTTTASLTSAPRMAATHGFGMTVTGKSPPPLGLPGVPQYPDQGSRVKLKKVLIHDLGKRVGCTSGNQSPSPAHWLPLPFG